MQSTSQAVAHYLRFVITGRRCEEAGDGELLRAYVERQDGDGFAALVRRHGPMVLGTARRVVGDYQLAEDVLQATFLVLARKARRIRRPEALAAWLHAVALHIAARARHARRRLQAPTPHLGSNSSIAM
jgi:DNA-directed RNA polymerase specialized sigma24 family protein